MRFAFVIFVVGLLPEVLSAQMSDSVFLEEFTWTEVRDALAVGTTTVIIPTGGTEQNGPHMVLGKHNYLVRYKAGEVARRLGSTLVARSWRMYRRGTLIRPADTCVSRYDHDTARRVRTGAGVRGPKLEATRVPRHRAARRQRGKSVVAGCRAERLNHEWAATPVRVHHLTDYYPGPGDAWLVTQGEREEDVGTHAGMHDTASLMFLNPAMLRLDELRPGTGGGGNGVVGNPARSTAAYGEQILEMQIDAAVRQIRALRESSRR